MSSSINLEYNLRILDKVLGRYCQSAVINRYVDLGCGNATLTLWVASRIKPRETIVVDLDERALEHAKTLDFYTFKCDLWRYAT